MSLIVTALWITLVGMGLVFIALLLLWGLMELMMRVTAKSAAAEAAEAAGEGEEPESEVEAPLAAGDGSLLRQRAAAAAVAVALAARPSGNGHLLRPPVELVSPWQAVLRATQLNKRSVMYSRKQRGSVR